MRVAAAALGTAGVLALVLFVAYETAQARIPQHRETLERLVRAQTGLNLRFVGLTLEWSWNGPQVVFRRVELGEPGETTVFVRAAQLAVAFDAWRSVQTGHLELGRITLSGPDIDLARPGAAARETRPGKSRAVTVLERWSGGRIEVEGGTLRIPDPAGAAEPVSLQIRRGSLIRVGRKWSGQTDIFLPERLGRSLHLTMALTGASPGANDASGSIRFDGRNLQFAAWREIVLRRFVPVAVVPQAGSGNLRGQLQLRAGAIDAGAGFIAARSVAFDTAPLGDVRADWKLSQRRGEWAVDLSNLTFGAARSGAPSNTLAMRIDTVTRRVQGTLDSAPAQSALALLHLATPAQGPGAGAERGTLTGLRFDYNGLQERAKHLTATAHWQPQGTTDSAAAFAISAQLSWLQTPAGNLLTADRVSATRGETRLELEGSLQPAAAGRTGRIDVTGRLSEGDIGAIKQLSGAAWQQWLGPRAAALESGRIAQAQFHFSGDPAEFAAGRALGLSQGEIDLSSAEVARTEQTPALHGLAGHLSWRDQLWSVKVTGGSAQGLEIRDLAATWSADTTSLRTLNFRAAGELSALTGWIDSHPDLVGAGKLPVVLPWSGPAQLDFDLHGGTGRAPRLQLALSDVRLSLAAQLPAAEQVRGAVIFDNGLLKRSTLTGIWLGGPLQVRLAPRGDTLTAQFDGRFDAAAAGQSLGLEPARLAGTTAWRGDWQWTPANAQTASRWHGEAQSDLFNIVSTLPAPFDKAAAQGLALRLEAGGSATYGTVNVTTQDRIQGRLAIAAGADGRWRVERAGVRVGGGDPALPEKPVIAIGGTLAALDLTTILAGWKGFIASSDAPPISAGIDVTALTIAGRTFAEVALDAQQTNSGLQTVFNSRDLAGRLHVPAADADHTPAQLHLTRLDLPRVARPERNTPNLQELAEILGTGAQLSVDQLLLEGRVLGRLTATMTRRSEGLLFDAISLTGGAHSGRGTLECAVDFGECRGTGSIDTSDVAATLATFAYSQDISAGRGTLDFALAWNPREPAASLSGQAKITLTSGSVRQTSGEGAPFALFVAPALLGLPPAKSRAFTRLEGEFDLHDGNAYTSDLHLDGDEEVIVRGRTGLVARDYDHTAWILRGDERLPAAIRRSGVAPAVASLWLGVRDFFTAGAPAKAFHVGGSWTDPVVTTQTGEVQP